MTPAQKRLPAPLQIATHTVPNSSTVWMLGEIVSVANPTPCGGAAAAIVRIESLTPALAQARLPHHVDTGWLCRACAIAPMKAAILFNHLQEVFVVSVYPNVQQTAVQTPEISLQADTIHLHAVHGIVLQCGDADVSLNHAGHVATRAEEVLTRASGVHCIQGGTVRIN